MLGFDDAALAMGAVSAIAKVVEVAVKCESKKDVAKKIYLVAGAAMATCKLASVATGEKAKKDQERTDKAVKKYFEQLSKSIYKEEHA